MPSPDLSTTIILSEIIIIETVAIIGASIYFFLKARNKSNKLNALLDAFINNGSERLSSLNNDFKKIEDLDGVDAEKYEQALKNIISGENTFYKYIINIFYGNNINLLESFPNELQKINKSLSDITFEAPPPPADTSNDEPEINIDDAIDDLLADGSTESEIENDPAFDLSSSDELDAEESTETNTEDDEIAEIPSELLNATPESVSSDTESNDNNDVVENDKNTTESIPEK